METLPHVITGGVMMVLGFIMGWNFRGERIDCEEGIMASTTVKIELRETWASSLCYWLATTFKFGTIEFWSHLITSTCQAKFGSRRWRYFHFAFVKHPRGVVNSFFDALVCAEESHGCG